MEELIKILERDGNAPGDPGSLSCNNLLEAVRSLPEGPAWGEGFYWLSGWIAAEAVQDVLLDMLSWPDAPALAEMVDCLTSTELPQSFSRRAWERFRCRFEKRTEHYWTRAQALRGALVVSQGSPVLVKKLQACLLDVSLDDDRLFLRHVVKVMGAILRRYPDDDFRSLLKQLSNLEEASDEAALELGLDRLKDALVAPTGEALLATLSLAHEWFEKSLQQSERRPDAALFELCTQTLIEAQSTRLEPALYDRLPKIRRAAIEYSAFAEHRHASSSWLAMSALERFHWISMATRLARAAQSLSKEIWLDVALVIEDELLSIFYPGKEIFSREDASGIDLVARDAVVMRLQQRRYYLQAVDQWLSENQGHAKAIAVTSLRNDIQAALEASLHRRPFEDTTSSRLVEVLTEAGFSEAVASMATSQLGVSIDRNGRVAELWQTVMRQFADQHNCKEPTNAQDLLMFLTTLILRFLDFRANVGVNTDPASEYIFRRGPDLPVEQDLQLDFLKFLHSNDAPSFRAEARDTGSGRADIAIEYRGVQTIIEVKKDDNVPGNAALADRYAGQATGYLTTGVQFGFLLVLDLTDRKGHQPNIAEQISVERKVPYGSTTEYRIVVARIQARRKTPHELR